MQFESNQYDNIQRKFFTSSLSLFLLSTPVILTTFSPSILTPVAVADVRAQQKRTYFRFVPKLTTGRDFYKTELKAAVDSEDWKVIEKFFEVYVSKYNPNDPNQIDATDSYVNVHFYRPMTVFAGSFAEKGSSPKQKALMEAEDKFATAMSDLEGYDGMIVLCISK
jgi:hypothetical protein